MDMSPWDMAGQLMAMVAVPLVVIIIYRIGARYVESVTRG